MADFITQSSMASLHSPNRKRTREASLLRSSNYYCKSVASTTSSIEVMETNPFTSISSVTQPRSSIHSIQNKVPSMKPIENDTSAHNNNSTNAIVDSSVEEIERQPLQIKVSKC